MPTLLEVLGVKHQHPDWVADGISLMPLINQLAANPAANDTSLRPAEHPLVFKLAGQSKIINNQWASVVPPPLATENLLESTDGVLRPTPAPPSVFSRGGTLIPSLYTDARYLDAVIVSRRPLFETPQLASKSIVLYSPRRILFTENLFARSGQPAAYAFC